MKVPTLSGVIRRRILFNYRVDPEIAERLLPKPFRPKLVRGYAVAGICLIRLEEIRPKGLPGFVGFSSENSAHRFAVEWQRDDGTLTEGVFVPRRDTGSRINAFAGGRLFPGVHHHSRFLVKDRDGCIAIKVLASDGKSPRVDLEVRETGEFPQGSVFGSLAESSKFFEGGCIGYSSRPDSCVLDGLLLKVDEWRVSPLVVDRAQSSYFDDATLFPEGSIELDHALLMRDIPHEWHSEPTMNRE